MDGLKGLRGRSVSERWCWFTACNSKLIPVHEGKDRTEKEADHSRLVGGRFKKRGSILICLFFSGLRTS